MNLASGDDGIHADYVTQLMDGDVTVSKSYEGIEGANVEFYGGTYDVTSTDDGVNAANGDFSDYEFNLYVGGGLLKVNAQGDGLDSNGVMEIAGGQVYVNGPTGNQDGALDSDDGILLSGGDLIAVGSAGMVETPGSNSTKACICYNLTSTQAAGTEVSLKDSSGNVLVSMTAEKQFQSVVISSDGLKVGDTVTLSVGSDTQTLTLSSILTQFGTSMGGGMGGGPGGGQPGGQGGGPGQGGPGGR